MSSKLARIAGATAVVVGCLGFAAVRPAEAGVLDCTVDTGTGAICSGASGTVVQNGVTFYQFAGALWTTSQFQSTGTGVIDSFVRVSSASDAVVSGMNTSARPLSQDENSSPTFTHNLAEGAVPIVTIAGVQYYEFLLDINQQNSNPLLTLNEVELCSSATASLTILGTARDCAGTDFYSLDSEVGGIDGADNRIDLNYSANHGSGSGDLFMYIPVPPGGIADTSFIYLWSEFGEPLANNDGFEEWAVREAQGITPVPEPASLFLFGSGLMGLARYARKRRGGLSAQA
jgi:hypothetical protein